MVATAITPKELRPGDVLVLGFQSEADIQHFRESQGALLGTVHGHPTIS